MLCQHGGVRTSCGTQRATRAAVVGLMPRHVVATPAPTWDPSKLAAEHSLDSRRAAVHQLAEKLAEHPGSSTFRVIPMPEQSLAVLLLSELAEAAEAAHDATTVCCVLSCVANLRLVGLPSVDVDRVCSLVVHHAASGEPATRAFACAAAYNLSQEPWVLDTLSRVHVDAGEPLSATPGDPPEVAEHGPNPWYWRIEAPSRLHAATLWTPEQSLGRMGPAAQPWGCLSEVLPESPTLVASIGQW
jgi:hypothetical protein